MRGDHSAVQSGVHAFLKDPITAQTPGGPAIAPRGDYDIDSCEAGVGLCNCATHNRFTLSFDAYLQHLIEGRIALTPSR